LRLIVVHGLHGSKSSTRILCFLAKLLKASGVVLLGNTVSPTIVEWLNSSCDVKVFGVLGECDSTAVAVALSRIGGFIECKCVDYSGVCFLGVGLSGCQRIPEESVDIVFSSLPGFEYTCCEACSDRVDNVVKSTKPKLVVTGACREPCFDVKKHVFSPGSMRLGFLGLVEFTENREIHVRILNIERVITRSVFSPNNISI